MKILLRSPNWLGDAVLATALAPAIKQAYPVSHVTVLAHPRVAEIWQGCPGVEQVLPLQSSWWTMIRQLRETPFDLGIVVPHSFSSAWTMAVAGVTERVGYATEMRGWLLTERVPSPAFREIHEMEEYLGLLEYLMPGTYPREPRVMVSPEREHEASAWLARQKVDEASVVVALCPGATFGPSKRWPPEKFIEAAVNLRKRIGVHFVVIGSEAERALVDQVVKGVGETAVGLTGHPLGLVAAVMKRCQVAVSNDTGLMHLAAALRVPTVAIFGSTSPTWTGPVGEDHHVIYKQVTCSPCFQRTCIRNEKDYLCLKQIEADEAVAAVVSKLAGLQLIR